jgi:hypothetical protein
MLRHGGDFALLLVLSVGVGSTFMRCGSTSSADSSTPCLQGTALPPNATTCVPSDAGDPCCPPATCQQVPGGFACRP